MPVDEFFLKLADAVIESLGLEIYLEEPNVLRVKAGNDMWAIFWSLHGYTRGKGFTQLPDGTWTMPDDLQAVVMTVGSRYIHSLTPGDTVRIIEELSDVERSILHQYRVRNA